MKLVQKAYRVWVPSMIGEYPVFSINDIEPFYAESPSKAKNKLCISDYQDEFKNDYGYTDIRVRRAKAADKFDVGNGIVRQRWQIEHDKKEEARKQNAIDVLNNLPEDELYYVQDARSYVGNAMVFWGLNSSGYVCDILQAQKYTKQEILDKFVTRRETDIIWPSSHIEKATKVIIDMQRTDSSKSF